MITAGIDFGAKNVKVVILDDEKIVARGSALTGFDLKIAVKDASEMALKAAGLKLDEITHITETGIGQGSVAFAADSVSEVGANAKAGVKLLPSARTIIDVGAEEARAVKCDESGSMEDFVVNERCAAGAGAFVEAMARALEVELGQMGPMSLKATEAVPMNAQCTVFAESEVVSLIHAQTPKANIARAIHDAIAERVISMVRRLGITEDVLLVGGLAYDVGYVDSMKRGLGVEVHVPELPEYVSAYGAALVAQERAKE
ncbi:MAG: acyl-CoA dehydratase activase [Candidatus Hermodarchaeota archaeon]|nr:acyl-CoA dehydratase activase [Candidatus Hermodarchaeota archaeon]